MCLRLVGRAGGDLLRRLKCGADRKPGGGHAGQEKVAGFFCLAAIGAHIKGMVRSGKEADLIISIDGCPVQCAAKTMQHVEIEPAIQVIVTELGIEKSHDIVVDEKICARVVEKVKEELLA